jgi:hypothetical protein
MAGFKMPAGSNVFTSYIDTLRPPYKGVFSVILGMTWARAAIFWGSDSGRDHLTSLGAGKAVATVMPPLVISTLVQIINQPIVRASVTIQVIYWY